MKETDWAKGITDRLNRELSQDGSDLRVESGKKLIYANEIKQYDGNDASYNEMSYETDILIYEMLKDDKWKPRVVIETKVNSITTHDAITYSQKASTHKYVHPYLRYGIFVGNWGKSSLPGRLFRHGAHFDFMVSWEAYEPSPKEWASFLQIIRQEIDASRKLEDMIFNSRKGHRTKYSVVHKPLVTMDK